MLLQCAWFKIKTTTTTMWLATRLSVHVCRCVFLCAMKIKWKWHQIWQVKCIWIITVIKNRHCDVYATMQRRHVWRWLLKMLMPRTELSVNCSRGQVNAVCSQVKCDGKSHQVNRPGTGEKYKLQDYYPEINCIVYRQQHCRFHRHAGLFCCFLNVLIHVWTMARF